MQEAIRAHKACPAFGAGQRRVLDTGEPAVFAVCCEWQTSHAIAVPNLADRPCIVALALSDAGWSRPVQVFGDQQVGANAETDRPYHIALNPSGYRWFRRETVRLYGRWPPDKSQRRPGGRAR